MQCTYIHVVHHLLLLHSSLESDGMGRYPSTGSDSCSRAIKRAIDPLMDRCDLDIRHSTFEFMGEVDLVQAICE